jgi:hypothetical protein
MASSIQPGSCRTYIASIIRPHSDRYLAANGFCGGMVIFALPDYGIQFKCQAEGQQIDLEFGAFFALLRFVESSLAAEKIKAVTVLSSCPEFVFAFTGKSRHLQPDSNRERLLKERTAKLSVTVSYIERHRNQALVSPAEYPSLPEGKSILVKSKLTDTTSRSFRPIQKGIRL